MPGPLTILLMLTFLVAGMIIGQFRKAKLLREAEDALKKCRNGEKELTFDRISDSVLSLDREWRYTFLNESALATNPAGRATTLGKVIWDVHPELKGTMVQKKAEEAMRLGKVMELEYFYDLLDRWYAVKMYPSEDGLTMYRRDITDEKKALEEIARKERRFEAIIQNSSEGLCLFGADGTMLEISPGALRILGRPRNEIAGDSWSERIHPEDRPTVTEAFQRVLCDPQVLRRVEYRYIMPDGTTKWLEGSYTNLLDEPGLNAIVFNFRDITEAVMARERIIAERNLSDAIINSLPGIFYLLTQDGKFLRWNQNFERVSGYAADEIRQMRPFDFVTSAEYKALQEKLESIIRTGEDFAQLNILPKSGEVIPYFLSGKTFIYEGQPCMLGVGFDFTERLRTQELLTSTTSQLRDLAAHLQNIREEERIEIARDIHDDLGQQLTAVKIALFHLGDLLEDSTAASQAVQEIIEMTGTAINSIRSISTRLRPPVLDDLGLLEAMKWLIEEFEGRFAIHVSADLPEEAEIPDNKISTHLFRIFQETLTNIARHASATTVKVEFKVNGRHLCLKVQDNGKGIDTDESKTRHSLGFLGIKERTSMMGGHFTISSQPGKGTVIEVDVPTINDRSICTS